MPIADVEYSMGEEQTQERYPSVPACPKVGPGLRNSLCLVAITRHMYPIVLPIKQAWALVAERGKSRSRLQTEGAS